MKRVLITGASGFLGYRLVCRLADEKNYDVVVTTSRSNGLKFPEQVSVATVDLLDIKKVELLMKHIRPEVCIHLAWGQRESNYRNALSNYQWLAASVSMFAQFQNGGGKQFLFAGSSGEYEDYSGGISETLRPKNMSLYGQCKKAVSDLLLKSNSNVQVQVARCFTVYGPGDTHQFGAIPTAICTLLKGEKFTCENPRAIRDYIYVDDAVEAITRLLNSSFTGPMDIGSGIPRSMREVFYEIASQLHCPEQVCYSDKVGAETVLTADHSLLQEKLRMPPQIPFSEGIRRSIEYWRMQLEAEKYET